MIYDLLLHGLKESATFKRHYEKKLMDLLEVAPSDSSATSCIRKLKKGYEGFIKITSSQGKFVAKAVAKDPADTVIAMLKQIDDQIKQWRSARFTAPTKALITS
jgi:hypothetical protein